jgi:hypothetical protein
VVNVVLCSLSVVCMPGYISILCTYLLYALEIEKFYSLFMWLSLCLPTEEYASAECTHCVSSMYVLKC